MIQLFFKKGEVYYYDDEEVKTISGNKYEIEDERIGAGGNGVVYKCIDRCGNELAIKILLLTSEKSKSRFTQEVALMKKVKNDHAIRYIDEGKMKVSCNRKNESIQEVPFVIMELADENLLDYMKKNTKISYSTYVPQFRGLCEALQEIHKYAIHRDIKPENILIKGETWILSDFGLCEFLDEEEHQDLTGPHEKVGPIYWISPEAVNHAYFGTDNIRKYSDVYQLAMVFAFVLLGRYPGGQFAESDNLKIPEAIKEVILKSISNNYNRRPQDGAELLKSFNEATVGKS